MKVKRSAVAAALMVAALLLATSPASAETGRYWQCAPFARLFSGIQLFGRAADWWQQAVGKYAQGSRPVPGAVMVFKSFRSMRAGHVATVSQIISDRVIKVTHANWSRINGRRGQVETDVEVVDVSEQGDWSKVKVWYASLKDIGQTAYPVQGFIYKDRAGAAAVVPAAPGPAVTAAPVGGAVQGS